ncbi:MAG TPA: hypothetical protein VIU63_05945 [Nitrospira sp.]
MTDLAILVKIKLSEDPTALWRVEQVSVIKDGETHPVTVEELVFETRSEAEWDAKLRARWFLRKNFALEDHGDIIYETLPPPEELSSDSPFSR